MTAEVKLEEVAVRPLPPERLTPLIGSERMAAFEQAALATRALLGGRAVISVNSTAKGGGVAEMLQTLLAYARGAGVDARWLVIAGDAEFFSITKRIHNGLYGSPGDRGPLGKAERDHYQHVLRENARELLALVRPGDIVLLHDPQTAALAAPLSNAGANVVWRCHVGSDSSTAEVERAWAFLRPHLDGLVDAFVFSRGEFAPPWADPGRTWIVPPSIDPFSAKNEPLEPDEAEEILAYVGLIAGRSEPPTAHFTRRDGSKGRVDHRADVLQAGPPPSADTPLVVQLSRWDRIKDMEGVMYGFTRTAAAATDAHLVLAGPGVSGVADDPEAAAVLDECEAAWRNLPHHERARVHLACVPMTDPDEAAAIANALQRHATVVVQKSLAEGFGLTVAEAMWKGRPIVASAVGGIRDQITNREHGLLIDDPADLDAFGQALRALLDDPPYADRLGQAARKRATAEFLPDRHLAQWGELLHAALTARAR